MSSQQPEPAKVTTDEASPNAADPMANRVFPVLLVMVTVLPLALGVGFTFQAAPVPVTRIVAADHVTSPIKNQIHTPSRSSSAAIDRSKADELLRAGRYEVALHIYRSMGHPDSLRAPPELALRVAMCQEGLGHWDEALQTYRSVASSHHRTMACAAVLGQSRIWVRLNEFSKAESLLRALLLSSGEDSHIPVDKLAEIAIPYAIVVSEQLLSSANMPMDGELVPVSNPIDWSMADALQWADSLASEDEARKSDGVTSPGSAVSNDNQKEAVDGSVDGKLGRPLSCSVPRQPLVQSLTMAVAGSGLKLKWSEDVRDRATTQELGFSVQGIPLNMLLTAACNELRASWELRPEDRTISLSGNDSALQSSETCRGMLAAVIATFPDSQLVGPAQFVLAQLAAANQQPEESARLYASLTRSSISPLAVRSAFNAAVLYRRLNDLERTCQSLEVVVHGAPGHELHTRALILFGQTLIDRGDFREAAFQLRRAANSRHVPDEQARAAVFLAMAQLLDGKPQDAAEALFSHRFQFQQPSARNAAALLTSIARWRTADHDGRLRESAFLYRSIVAVEDNSEWLGSAGKLLLGQAMRDADLEDRMAELFLDALQCRVPLVIERKMNLAMADYWYSRHRIGEAKEIWSAIYSKGSADSIVAGMRIGEVALEERHPEICIEICRKLQHHDNAPKPAIQKLSGRAHEMAGRPVLAAQCFAGQWPLP